MQIVFEGQQATGVVMRHEGKEKIVKATEEVILAAGTVGTTKLLLLSGVGPKAHLQELKVQLVLLNSQLNIYFMIFRSALLYEHMHCRRPQNFWPSRVPPIRSGASCIFAHNSGINYLCINMYFSRTLRCQTNYTNYVCLLEQWDVAAIWRKLS